MTSLEPCPFCGGEAEEIEPSNSSPFWEIHCKKCWATMAGTHRGINQKKWNTRYKRTCHMRLKSDDCDEIYPVYQYVCSACGSDVDGNEDEPWYPLCPYCGAEVADGD